MTEGIGYRNALEAMDRFVASLHECDSPFEFATTLVRATAQQYNADIATLFRVSPSRTELIAEAGYDQRGEQIRANVSYTLPWAAQAEADMRGGGLTAWVAVSGRALFVKNAAELLDKSKHPAHRGAWDADFHPDGAQTTFGCMYAVPLRLVGKGGLDIAPKESVLGVYKIERRRDNVDGTFTEEQLREFDLAAKQLSLVILLYERAMSRILGDARHAVRGRLGDAIQQLDIAASYFAEGSAVFAIPYEKKEERVAATIERVKDDASKVASWLRQSMQVYTHPIEMENRTVFEFVQDTIEARSNQQQEVRPEISRDMQKMKLRMNVAQSWDLHTALLSLLNNAIHHSGKPDSVLFRAEAKSEQGAVTGRSPLRLVFTIEDGGRGIPDETIREAQSEQDPISLTAASGTGLRRVYRVAKFRDWSIEYKDLQPGSRFRLSVGVSL